MRTSSLRALGTAARPTAILRPAGPTTAPRFPSAAFRASTPARMASSASAPPPPEGSSKTHFPPDGSLPGERFEVRQTHPTGDYKPDASRSLRLSAARQALVDDIIALYEMKPTVERVRRYTPDCVYNDQFVYANDRYKMAGQWFALPKLFKSAESLGCEVVTNDRDLIQFKHEQSWTFKVIPKTAVINALVSLSLDPASIDSDFIRVKYHKDQANDKDYSNEGLGATFKKWQADNVAKRIDSPEVQAFEADKDAGKEERRTYGSGGKDGDAPVKNF
ncbi:hypothetical protein GGR52DRAFT_575254 [Hypoxylon sp. FL1284]|nr:hypothetical protein GGR52DRAFT_575254 [Hypoxylon sp. FL1284]